jgi:hypothetical protein
MTVSPGPVGRGEKPQHVYQRADQRLLRRFRNSMQGASRRLSGSGQITMPICRPADTQAQPWDFSMTYSGRIASCDAFETFIRAIAYSFHRLPYYFSNSFDRGLARYHYGRNAITMQSLPSWSVPSVEARCVFEK